MLELPTETPQRILYSKEKFSTLLHLIYGQVTLVSGLLAISSESFYPPRIQFLLPGLLVLLPHIMTNIIAHSYPFKKM